MSLAWLSFLCALMTSASVRPGLWRIISTCWRWSIWAMERKRIWPSSFDGSAFQSGLYTQQKTTTDNNNNKKKRTKAEIERVKQKYIGTLGRNVSQLRCITDNLLCPFALEAECQLGGTSTWLLRDEVHGRASSVLIANDLGVCMCVCIPACFAVYIAI